VKRVPCCFATEGIGEKLRSGHFGFLAIGMPFFTARQDNENLKPAHEAGSRNQNP